MHHKCRRRPKTFVHHCRGHTCCDQIHGSVRELVPPCQSVSSKSLIFPFADTSLFAVACFHSHPFFLHFIHSRIFLALPVLCTTFRPQSHSLLLSRTCSAAAEPAPGPVYLATSPSRSAAGVLSLWACSCSIWSAPSLSHSRTGDSPAHQSAQLFDRAARGQPVRGSKS